MARYTVELPEGGTMQFDGPNGATDEQIIAGAQQALKSQRPGKHYATPQIDRSNRLGLAKPETAGFTDAVAHDATFGFSDEAQGIASALVNGIKAPFSSSVDFDPIGAYNYGKKGASDAVDTYRHEHPGAGLGASVIGGLAAIPSGVAGLVSEAPGFLARLAQGAKAGAAAGAAQGVGNGEGTGRLTGGVTGAIGGGLVGGAIPTATSIASPFTNGVRRLLPGGSGGLAVQRIAEAMKSDGIEPAAAGAAMDAAHANGVPAMLADQGDNLRRLLGAVYRQPGPGRTMVADALRSRQLGSFERVSEAINRDLGPTGNVGQLSDQLIDKAKRDAAPLYAKAYEQPMVDTPGLRSLMDRPSMKRAVGNAFRIAQEEGRNPSSLGFALDDAGAPKLAPTMTMHDDGSISQELARQANPSMQTLDYVKRGLDDVVESYRDPTTGRLSLDTEGRAINGTLRDYLGQVDEMNPAYAAARKAFAGPAGEKEALNRGADALNMSGGDIDRAIVNLSPSQREQYALGMRSSLVDRLSRRVDGGDKVGALLGTPQRREALQRAGGESADFARFGDTMEAERKAGDTYRAAMTGSPTAINLADDAMVGDAGIVSDAANRFIRGNGGLIGRTANALAPLLDASRFGVGRTGDSVREGLAATLLETDPAAMARSLDLLRQHNVLDAARLAKSNRIGVGTGLIGGSLVGSIAGRATN